MQIQTVGSLMCAALHETTLNDTDKQALLSMANEELAEELDDMLTEAASVANPMVLFGVCAITDASQQGVTINGVRVDNPLVAEKLSGKSRCFPYIVTCGTALEKWSEQYKNDVLASVWADEIKKKYLQLTVRTFQSYIKDTYHMSGYRAALNPGSRAEWPISGQKELFDILGGSELVKEKIGVVYTDSFLMLPTKTVSGISFESETAYENCQYCPLEKCPNRRAKRI